MGKRHGSRYEGHVQGSFTLCHTRKPRAEAALARRSPLQRLCSNISVPASRAVRNQFHSFRKSPQVGAFDCSTYIPIFRHQMPATALAAGAQTGSPAPENSRLPATQRCCNGGQRLRPTPYNSKGREFQHTAQPSTKNRCDREQCFKSAKSKFSSLEKKNPYS